MQDGAEQKQAFGMVTPYLRLIDTVYTPPLLRHLKRRTTSGLKAEYKRSKGGVNKPETGRKWAEKAT